ncbi:hypothetical protein BDQ12DRAFT_526845 [Crucibulum laeve]|uniref:Uncharacterized protein n=1 Tax=Crucibulum laeve TaxID=68775 RepID=A0A5C3LG82_9AGAR|nr:hypothetical protein BDQ12DRAFT_526845 [Crucibulum laeve]
MVSSQLSLQLSSTANSNASDIAMAPAAKIKHALNGAACFPGRVAISGGYAIGYNNFSPTTRKILLIILRVQTIWCKDLLAMVRNWYSDP